MVRLLKKEVEVNDIVEEFCCLAVRGNAEASLHFVANRELGDQVGGAPKKKSGGPVDPGEQKLYEQIRSLKETLNRLPPGPRPNRNGSDNSWDDATMRKKQNELRKFEEEYEAILKVPTKSN